MVIEIKNITKTYGNVKALDDLSVTFTNGIYGILGPNGAGKSTMINLLTDNVRRGEGEILCDGVDILKMGSDYRKILGYMPQQQKVYDNYSAISFMKYMAAIKGIPSKRAAGEIERLLKVVNLWDVRYKQLKGFSGGMKQRVLLAQALLGDPKFLILDEPTAGLDPNERIKIRNYIAEMSEDKIILFATHVVSDIECIADYVMLIKKGRLIEMGTTYEVIDTVEGKVGQIHCNVEDLPGLQRKYKTGNVFRTKTGLMLKVVGDELPENIKVSSNEITLEDVYLYYCLN
ncbi:MAG: ATP-binding cassette domain-containing protein [Butyrivibrio sp.]